MNTNNINNQNNEMKTTSQKVRDFLRYNNSVPLFIAVGIVLSGSAFAATPAGQQTLSQALVGEQTKVISIDNTLIATKDLTTWSPKAKVTGVTEDTDNYYVAYIFSTIDIVNYKWVETDKNLILTVPKDILKDYKSLADYVQYQLKQNIDAENDRLSRTQEIEKKNITQMQTVTSYTGLAGLILDENTKVEDPVAPAPDSNTPAVPPPPTVLTTTDPKLMPTQQQIDANANQQSNNSNATNNTPTPTTPANPIDTSVLTNSTPTTGTTTSTSTQTTTQSASTTTEATTSPSTPINNSTTTAPQTSTLTTPSTPTTTPTSIPDTTPAPAPSSVTTTPAQTSTPSTTDTSNQTTSSTGSSSSTPVTTTQ